MPKILLHSHEARRALARGVAKLAAAVEPTLGPKGLNAMIDRPVGSPIVTRDGVSIAGEIELRDRFENMGAQVAREVSMKTNEVAGDGTTTSIVLANALVQGGVVANERGAKAVDLCRGIDLAVAYVIDQLKASAKSANPEILRAVATIAATDAKLGSLVASAYERVGSQGIISAEFGLTTETTLDVVEGMAFDRGYISHHMVTDDARMEATLHRPYIIMTDLKVLDPKSLDVARSLAEKEKRPLLIIAEDMAPDVLMSLLSGDHRGKFLVVHPPEYGRWRKSLMEDLAIMTGGKVISAELGGRLETITADDLGTAERVITTASHTTIIRGGGSVAAIAARRAQVQKQHDVAPPNVEQDKLRERIAKLSGGTAIIYAGGVTPVEQRRTIQLIEDSLNAVRAAAEEGVVAGGGTALAHIAPLLGEKFAAVSPDVAAGVKLVQEVLTRPLWRVVTNAGADADAIVAEVARRPVGQGYNAASGEFGDMFEAGVIDPVRVTFSALQNAASVATLILTTETLIGDIKDDEDPTAGPALGGGAEHLGRK